MRFLRRFIHRLFDAVRGFSQHDCTLLAAAIAYYLAFSLFPLLLVLAAGLGYAFRFSAVGQNAHERVLNTIEEQASPALADAVKQTFDSVRDRAVTGGAVGLALLVVAAVAIFTHVDYAFDRIWSASIERTPGWRAKLARLLFVRLKALLMMAGVGAFIIIVMIVSMVLTSLQPFIADAENISPLVQPILQPLLHMLLNIVAFTLVYRFVPKVRVRWSSALAGAGLAAVLWELGRQALAVYLVRHDLPSAYGLIGSFMAIMLWTYYAMLVVLFGAEFVRASNESLTPVNRAEEPTALP